ncbi:MAG: spermidine synthase [Bacteroidales bacterium]|jgi:hypothetical protein|nr:spermidine synthase [Bacteroidales bacterium]MDN5329303.1 spermidine synthase [Bacteroidales bacterium]NLH51916.1 hypothetical protein [Bacteroidales bacterium]NPV37450.1 hypothetical protein [Bacteroidales bacterium]
MKSLRAWLIGLILAIQGFSMMVFEFALPSWLRQWLGASFAAQALSIGVFTVGLAAGAWIASQKTLKKPFKSMGFLLIGTALSEMLYPLAMNTLTDISLQIPGWIFTTLTVIWVLPAVMASGAMYPLAVKSIPGRRNAGWFYAAGLIGAGLGIASVIFQFYGYIHLGTALFLCGLPLFVAGLGMFILKEKPQDSEIAPYTEKTVEGFTILAFFLGVAGMIFQLNTLRMGNLVFGASYRTFGSILLWILLASGMGSILASRNKKAGSHTIGSLNDTVLLYCIFMFISLPLYRSLFYMQSFAWHSLTRNDTGYQLWVAFQAFIPLAFVAVPSLMNGFIFTHLAISWGREAGKLYAAETLGTLVGALTGYSLLIPLTGPLYGNIILGLMLMGVMGAFNGKRFFKKKYLLIASGLALALSILLKPTAKELFSGVFRTGEPHNPGEIAADDYGRHASVAVSFDNHGLMSLLIDGKPDAGISMTELPSTDEPVEILLGALPLSLKPEATHIATIGLGSGLTASILSQGPNTQINDILEIEPAVVKAAENFGERVAAVWYDPRSRIHISDARGWFLHNEYPYDIIVSEPSNPWVMGNSSLFTEGFYQLIKKSLHENGIFVQWIQLYETNEDILASILFQLGRVFEDYTIYLADDGNMLVVAGKNTLQLEPDEKIFSQPALARHLTRLGIYSPGDLKIRKLAQKKLLQPWVDKTSTKLKNHSDLLPVIEPLSLRALFFAEDAYWINDLKRISAALLLTDKPGITTGISPYGYRLSAVTRAIKGKMLYDLLSGSALDTNHLNTPGLSREISQLIAGFQKPDLDHSQDFLVLLNEFCFCLEEFITKEEALNLSHPFHKESQAGQLLYFHEAIMKKDIKEIDLETGKILSHCNLWPQPIVEFVELVNQILALDYSHQCTPAIDTLNPAFLILMHAQKNTSIKTLYP